MFDRLAAAVKTAWPLWRKLDAKFRCVVAVQRYAVMSDAELAELRYPPLAGAVREQAAEQALTAENKPHLAALREAYAGLAKFDADTLMESLKATATAREVKNKVLVMPARVACTGSKVGPSLYHLFEVLGQAEVLKRFDAALARM